MIRRCSLTMKPEWNNHVCGFRAQVKVTKTLIDRGDEMFVRSLTVGDYFGERALDTYVNYSCNLG